MGKQTITNPPAEKLHPAYLRLQKLTDLSYIMNRSGVSSEIKNSRGNMDYDKNTIRLGRSFHVANRSLRRHIKVCFFERYQFVQFDFESSEIGQSRKRGHFFERALTLGSRVQLQRFKQVKFAQPRWQRYDAVARYDEVGNLMLESPQVFG